MHGKMLWFNEVKGHGFISTEEGERLYADGADFVSGPPEGYCAGIAVTFQVADGEGERKAGEIRLVTHDAPRRARRRHSGSSLRN